MVPLDDRAASQLTEFTRSVYSYVLEKVQGYVESDGHLLTAAFRIVLDDSVDDDRAWYYVLCDICLPGASHGLRMCFGECPKSLTIHRITHVESVRRIMEIARESFESDNDFLTAVGDAVDEAVSELDQQKV